MTESEHQILLMCWAKKVSLAGRSELSWLFHIPNGGGRSKREAGILKAMGVKPGVSDLFLPVPKIIDCRIDQTTEGGIAMIDMSGQCLFRAMAGLWIEMKAEGGRAGEDQLKWIYAMRNAGYEARICVGWEEAVEVIKEYLGGEWPSVEMGEMAARMLARACADAQPAQVSR